MIETKVNLQTIDDFVVIKMKRISYIHSRLKEHTIPIEEKVNIFFVELFGNVDIISKTYLISIKDAEDEFKVYCYRELNEEIKEDLESIANIIIAPERKELCKG